MEIFSTADRPRGILEVASFLCGVKSDLALLGSG